MRGNRRGPRNERRERMSGGGKRKEEAECAGMEEGWRDGALGVCDIDSPES